MSYQYKPQKKSFYISKNMKNKIYIGILLLFVVISFYLIFPREYKTEASIEVINNIMSNPSFELIDNNFPQNWFVKNVSTYDVDFSNKNHVWYWEPLKQGISGKTLFFNVTKNNELEEPVFIKSKSFDISKKRYKLVFYTKTELKPIGDSPKNAAEIDFVVLKDGVWDKYFYLHWNNTGITYNYDKEIPIEVSFENGEWNKITIEMNLTSVEGNKAVIYFGSGSQNSYDGYFLIDDILLW